jgi:hypothetical protein
LALAAPTLAATALHFFAAPFGAILFGLGAKFNQSAVFGRADRQFAAALPGASAVLAAALIGAHCSGSLHPELRSDPDHGADNCY